MFSIVLPRALRAKYISTLFWRISGRFVGDDRSESPAHRFYKIFTSIPRPWFLMLSTRKQKTNSTMPISKFGTAWFHYGRKTVKIFNRQKHKYWKCHFKQKKNIKKGACSKFVLSWHTLLAQASYIAISKAHHDIAPVLQAAGSGIEGGVASRCHHPGHPHRRIR